VLIVKADRQEPLVIVRLSLAAEVAFANPAACGRRSRSQGHKAASQPEVAGEPQTTQGPPRKPTHEAS
jgi:hypothetical protein